MCVTTAENKIQEMNSTMYSKKFELGNKKKLGTVNSEKHDDQRNIRSNIPTYIELLEEISIK